MSVVDANLPIFRFLPSKDSHTETTIAYSQFNSLPSPKYIKRRDSSLSDAYLATLHDAYYPDIIYASIQAAAVHPPPPQLTPEEIRKRNVARQRAMSNPNTVSPKEVELAFGEPVKPAPLVPSQVTINLYNPDDSVILTQKPSSWNSGPYFEFSLPKVNFVQPTGSKLDSELGALKAHLAVSPMATFRWRKEGGVLSRASLRCSYVGSANALLHDDGVRAPDGNGGKRKTSMGGSPDPDVTVAIFTNGIGGGKQQGRGEVTIFEANLRKVEVDDVKGLELMLVMSATVIGEIWFGDMKSVFNLSGKAPNVPSGPGRVATISVQQQQELITASNQVGRRMQTRSPTLLTNGVYEPVDNRDELPAYGGPRTGPYPEEKVRPTQEQLHNQAAEALRMRTDREYQAMVLVQQEAEARRLQEEFEREAREEQRRKEEEIERETERLRIEYEYEQQEMRRQEQRRSTQAGLRIQTNIPTTQEQHGLVHHQPSGPTIAYHPQANPYANPYIASMPGSFRPENQYLQNAPHRPRQNSAFESPWFAAQTPNESKPNLSVTEDKCKRKSFMGWRTGFMSGGNTGDQAKREKDNAKTQNVANLPVLNGGAGPYGGLVVPGASEANKSKLSKKTKPGKKKSSMW